MFNCSTRNREVDGPGLVRWDRISSSTQAQAREVDINATFYTVFLILLSIEPWLVFLNPSSMQAWQDTGSFGRSDTLSEENKTPISRVHDLSGGSSRNFEISTGQSMSLRHTSEVFRGDLPADLVLSLGAQKLVSVLHDIINKPVFGGTVAGINEVSMEDYGALRVFRLQIRIVYQQGSITWLSSI